MARRRLTACLVALALAGPAISPGPVYSQESDTKQQLLDTLEQARIAFEAEDWETAIVHFEKAFDMKRIAAIQYRLGICYEQVGDLDRARQAYEHFLILKPQSSQRDQVEETLARLKEKKRQQTPEESQDEEDAATANLTIHSDPPGARVSLNEEFAVIGKTPVNLRLDPGPAELIFRLDGYETETKSVTIDETSRVFLDVTLNPVGGTAPEVEITEQTEITPPPEPAKPRPLRTVGQVATWTGVGLIAASAVTWVMYGSSFGTFRTIDRDRRAYTRTDAETAASQANSRLSWSVGLSVSGAVLLASGLTLTLLGGD